LDQVEVQDQVIIRLTGANGSSESGSVEHQEAEHQEAPDQVDHQDIRQADHQEVQDCGSSGLTGTVLLDQAVPEHLEKCRIKWCATGIRFK
jgi:hypothetical protein